MTQSAQHLALKSLSEWWTDAGSPVDFSVPATRSKDSAPQRPSNPTRTPAKPPSQEQPRRLRINPVEIARKTAAAAEDLASLRGALSSFENCDLKAGARNTVINDGVDSAQILLVGEAPGQEEDRTGKPFVGKSGQLLDRMLASIGLNRAENVYITNTIYWRPPANRAPTPEELAICLPFLERQISLLSPRLIIPVGKSAAHALLQTQDGIMRLRGRRANYHQEGIEEPVTCLPILHPAYLLRRPQDKALVWKDLRLIADICDELGLPRRQL